MLEITPRIQIAEGELHWSFVRAGGPGGQNVNKVASKAVLRWDVSRTPNLPADVKARLLVQERGRITAGGELLLSSQRFRDQGRNIGDCLEKLRDIVLRAATPPRRRKRTRPTRAARAARVQEKRRRSAVKKARRRPADE